MIELSIIGMAAATSGLIISAFASIDAMFNGVLPDAGPTLYQPDSYRIESPLGNVCTGAIASVQLINNAIEISDPQRGTVCLPLDAMLWVEVYEYDNPQVEIRLFCDAEGQWRTVRMWLPAVTAANVYRSVKQTLSASMSPDLMHISPMMTRARQLHQNLHGYIRYSKPVNLVIFPHLLIVVDGDRIVTRIDVRHVRRVVAMRQSHNQLVSLFQDDKHRGIVRLYSSGETIAFETEHYLRIARAIKHLSGSSIEHVRVKQKTAKNA